MDSKQKVDQDKFLRLMVCYASIQPYRAPDFSKQEVGWYWYQEFKFRSLEELKNAFDSHIRKQDHFPSLRELNQALSGTLDDDTLSKITALNILGAIQKFGWCNWPEAKNYIGELGVKIVDRFGGWPNVCEMLTMDNYTYLQNYMREATKSYLLAGVVENNHNSLPEGRKISGMISELSKSMDISKKDVAVQISNKISEFSNSLVVQEDEIPW